MRTKDNLILKAITIIDPITDLSEVTQYNYKKVMKVANLVEITWLTRCPWMLEITYGRGSEFISHEFLNTLIKEEYGIKSKPNSSGSPQASAIVDKIHQ